MVKLWCWCVALKMMSCLLILWPPVPNWWCKCSDVHTVWQELLVWAWMLGQKSLLNLTSKISYSIIPHKMCGFRFRVTISKYFCEGIIDTRQVDDTQNSQAVFQQFSFGTSAPSTQRTDTSAWRRTHANTCTLCDPWFFLYLTVAMQMQCKSSGISEASSHISRPWTRCWLSLTINLWLSGWTGKAGTGRSLLMLSTWLEPSGC